MLETLTFNPDTNHDDTIGFEILEDDPLANESYRADECAIGNLALGGALVQS
jgi:hypothetical protein